MKKIVLLLITIFAFQMTFCGCKKNCSSSLEKSYGFEELSSSWEGSYVFEEMASSTTDEDTYVMRIYKIDIYKYNNELIANINVNGFQIAENILAKVIGDDKNIDLVFSSEISGNSTSKVYNNGDIIISFLKDNDEGVITEWRKMQPMIIVNREPGTYFEKVAESID